LPLSEFRFPFPLQSVGDGQEVDGDGPEADYNDGNVADGFDAGEIEERMNIYNRLNNHKHARVYGSIYPCDYPCVSSSMFVVLLGGGAQCWYVGGGVDDDDDV
jgi:hypothetical protein